jgi:hypothetical protein
VGPLLTQNLLASNRPSLAAQDDGNDGGIGKMAEPNGERIVRLEGRVTAIEKVAVAFAAHQKRADEFFIREDERAKARGELDKKRSRIHYWWLSILSAIIISSVIGLFNYLMNFEKRHTITKDQQPAISSSVQPQDARIPNLR